jgi:hypothetical protein
VQALLGRARVAELRGDAAYALATVTEAHVKHAWFAPALMEKARLALSAQGWPAALEAASALQQADAANVLAFALRGALRTRTSAAMPTLWHASAHDHRRSCLSVARFVRLRW